MEEEEERKCQWEEEQDLLRWADEVRLRRAGRNEIDQALAAGQPGIVKDSEDCVDQECSKPRSNGTSNC